MIQPFDIACDGDWVDGANRCLSPNFDERPQGSCIDLLVIHCISLPPAHYGGRYIHDFFCNRLNTAVHPYFEQIAALRVSAHLFIDRFGGVTQFVALNKRAWHAGVSCFKDRSNCNDYSIGIELEGTDEDGFEAQQYLQLVRLTKLLQARWPAIVDDHIVGHSDIAPDRKTDPGIGFDWEHYRTTLASLSVD